MKETITTQDSLTEPEDRVMNDGPKCVVCQQEISFSQMFDNYGTGLFVHRGCAKRAVSTHRELAEALQEISEGKGRYSCDPLTHAENCIEDMKEVAAKALAKAKVRP